MYARWKGFITYSIVLIDSFLASPVLGTDRIIV